MWLMPFNYYFFFFPNTLRTWDFPEFRGADLVVTPDSAEWAIPLKSISTAVEHWEWKWNELWNLQHFPAREPLASRFMLAVVTRPLMKSSVLCLPTGWTVRTGGTSQRKLLMAKWRWRWGRNEAAGENSGNAAASWEMGNHGASQGSCGHGVWQSGHNSALIHHLGINAASRYNHGEILHSLPPSNRKKNSPLPQAASAWGETGQMNKNYWPDGEENITFIWGQAQLQR